MYYNIYILYIYIHIQLYIRYSVRNDVAVAFSNERHLPETSLTCTPACMCRTQGCHHRQYHYMTHVASSFMIVCNGEHHSIVGRLNR